MPIEPKDPIAIIGIGCRLPGGAHSPAAFWDLLRRGDDAIVDIPSDRWSLRRFYHPNPEIPGKTYVRQGGFLQTPLDGFDPNFFGITPREAAYLDPQQRLLLETAWEAFEDAGLSLEQIRGSQTGVYVGAFTMDNMGQQLGMLNRQLITNHTAVAATLVMLANRLSYTFDLLGPSIALDTACSSSLVSLHLACQALWGGECEMALAGGVNIMFRPEFVIAMCKGRFLSPTARCKVFDASADGYVRGEGGGLILLKPLSQAQADGDSIYALIHATGLNQDGHSSTITVPNGLAQEKLMRQVIAQAGITPAQIGYVEAHGTGTAVGDPIEANSLGAVLSEGRAEGARCWVASVKTNIGHLEAAAGVASLIKVALMLKHKEIPPHLHLLEPNPAIDFEALGLRVPQRVEPWPNDKSPAYAAINSFGYGGTNAHVILGEAPTITPPPPMVDPYEAAWPRLLPLSAGSEKALNQVVADQSVFWGRHSGLKLRDYHYTAAKRRSHHQQRLALVFESAADLRAQLAAYAAGDLPQGVNIGSTRGRADKDIVFVYTGMGPQWWGMGYELMQTEPIFRAVIEDCERIYSGFGGGSLLELFAEAGSGEPMNEPIHAQPANFALQIALTAVWRAYGLQPSALVGHSVGEIAAAYVAGALTLEDALRVIYHRGRLMQKTLGQGRMLAAGLSLTEAESLIGEYRGLISIAAENSATSVTLAGQPEALTHLAAALEAQGIFQRFLKVEVAYHSYQMDALEDEFMAALGDIQPYAPEIPLYSTVTTDLIAPAEQDAAYWWRNARQHVALAPALRNIITDAYQVFIEVGPHPVLAPAIQEALRDAGAGGYSVHSLRRQAPERRTMLENLGALYTQGFILDWDRLAPDGQFLRLPPYPWDREKLWVENEISRQDRLGTDWHPLLDQRVVAPQTTWEGELNPHFSPYLNDHVIEEAALFPAAGYIELGLAVTSEMGEAVRLEDVSLQRPLNVENLPIIRVTVDEAEGRFKVYSRPANDERAWVQNAEGRYFNKTDQAATPRFPEIELENILARCQTQIPKTALYETLASLGLRYGAHFQGIQRAWQGTGEVFAEVYNDQISPSEHAQYRLHPTLLDACFQTLILALDPNQAQSGLYLPVHVDQIRLHRKPDQYVLCYTCLMRQTSRTIEGDIWLSDMDGQVLVEVIGLRLQRVAETGRKTSADDWLHKLRWEAQALPQDVPLTSPAGRWLVFTDQFGYGERLAANLIEQGIPSTLARRGEFFSALLPDSYQIDPFTKADFAALLDELGGEAPAGIIYAWGLDLALNPSDDEYFQTGIADGVALLHLIQALDEADLHLSGGKLVILTGNTQQITDEEAIQAPGQGALWGLGRVMANEHADLQARLIDLDLSALEDSLPLVLAEILAGDSETEIAFREGARFVHRLEAVKPPPIEWIKPEAQTGYALKQEQVGVMDSLHFEEVLRRIPAPDEIEIGVMVAGLNFKDIMKAMNLLPEHYLQNTFYAAALGLECAGIVTRVGAGVTDFQPGDEVIAFHKGGGFASYVTLPARYAIKKPSTLPFEQSVVFVNFVTAYYALAKVARLRPGERVLIHSATGGVGLAALQVATWLGAKIYTTAGTEEKRAYLQAMDLQVSDSRSLKFVDDVQRWTHNAGVDVVLNTLSGAAMGKSLELLAPYGRFIEIGKRDITENKALAMAAFDRNLTFTALDLDRLMLDWPKLFSSLLKEVSEHFESGTFYAIPTATYPPSEVSAAFRLMAQAKHIGKVALALPPDEALEIKAGRSQGVIRPDASYLVTGGLGGFGLEVARWLVEQGAQHLVLVSRSGVNSQEAQTALAAFEARGVNILAAQVNVAVAEQVAGLIATIQAQMPPLRGIIHSAMVLDDTVLSQMSRERFETVMYPKALGAWYLHQHTLDIPLDFCVYFSSISALIGNPRQGNYVAANAFLDALAQYRRAQGLAAMSLNWGSISRVGAVARNRKVELYLNQLGIRGLDPQAAAAMLGRLLAENPIQMGVIDMDWGRWAASGVNVTRAPLYADLVAAYAQKVEEQRFPLVDRLLAALPKEYETLVLDFLREQVSKVTRLPSSRLDPNMRLDQLGIDSLMGVELNTLIRLDSGVEFSVMTLMQGLTIEQLARQLLDKLAAGHPKLSPPQTLPEEVIL